MSAGEPFFVPRAAIDLILAELCRRGAMLTDLGDGFLVTYAT